MAESLICKKISAIMSDITYISKDRKNANQGYQFRGIDDIYNELHSIMSKHMVFTVPEVIEEKSEERQSRSGGTLIYRILKIKYTFYCEDGSNISAIVIGEGQDSGDKASNKAMAVAHKYALLQVFCIPTDELKDPENDSPESLPIKDRTKTEIPVAKIEAASFMDCISEEQALDIAMLCTKKGVETHKIVLTYQKKCNNPDGIADLIDIPNKYYQEIVDKLNSKPDKKEGA
jgi:hypothetical protein